MAEWRDREIQTQSCLEGIPRPVKELVRGITLDIHIRCSPLDMTDHTAVCDQASECWLDESW